MEREIRAATDEEFADFIRVTFAAFGEVPTDENLEDDRLNGELDRSLGVRENGRWVAAAGAYTFDMTVPGGGTLPAAGVTWVGVLPTHRRQGLLTAMMESQLDDVVERGEPLAILTASEAVIYGRFGYGVASRSQAAEITTARSAFHHEPETGGHLRLVDKDEASKLLPPVWDAYRLTRPGELTRAEKTWELHFRDRESWRDGASPNFYVVHEAANGTADGYARYRVKDTWTEEKPGNLATAQEVAATDPEVEAALWRYLLSLDLVATVKTTRRPIDDWLPLRLADSRAYRTTFGGDWLWARLLDIETCLSARTYGAEGSVVFGVDDPFRPATSGAYRLDAGPDGATCTRVAATVDPDITLDVRFLGAAYLGGPSFVNLARAGVVHGDLDALRRADHLFRSDPAPFCCTGF